MHVTNSAGLLCPVLAVASPGISAALSLICPWKTLLALNFSFTPLFKSCGRRHYSLQIPYLAHYIAYRVKS